MSIVLKGGNDVCARMPANGKKDRKFNLFRKHALNCRLDLHLVCIINIIISTMMKHSVKLAHRHAEMGEDTQNIMTVTYQGWLCARQAYFFPRACTGTSNL